MSEPVNLLTAYPDARTVEAVRMVEAAKSFVALVGLHPAASGALAAEKLDALADEQQQIQQHNDAAMLRLMATFARRKTL